MRKYAFAPLFVLLVLNLAGCASLKNLNRAQEMNQQAQANLIRSYDRIGDAYHILAYEYYKLAADAEKHKASASQVDEYKTRMTLYDTFYRQAKQAAEDLRVQERNQRAEELPNINSSAAAPANPRSASAPIQGSAPRTAAPAPVR